MASRILHRRGTAAAWASANPVLAMGEPGWATDAGKQTLKIGDGVTPWNSLAGVANDPVVQASALAAAANAQTAAANALASQTAAANALASLLVTTALDGGSPTTDFSGTTPIDGGTP